jgi:hypothetical protein
MTDHPLDQDLHGPQAAAWFKQMNSEAHLLLDAVVDAIASVFGADREVALTAPYDQETGDRYLLVAVRGDVSSNNQWQQLIEVHREAIKFNEGTWGMWPAGIRPLTHLHITLQRNPNGALPLHEAAEVWAQRELDEEGGLDEG